MVKVDNGPLKSLQVATPQTHLPMIPVHKVKQVLRIT